MTSTLLQRKKIVPMKRSYTMRVADERPLANKGHSASDGGMMASTRSAESFEAHSLEGVRASMRKVQALMFTFFFFLSAR